MTAIKVGDVFKTKQGCSIIVIDDKDQKNITVQFTDKHSHIAIVQSNNLKAGSVKNPYYPSVRGMGYMGVGQYVSSKDKVVTIEYKAWLRMMSRCYSNEALIKQPWYVGCTVDADWHNFQNFAKWYVSHDYYGMGYHLDKDILIKGNKVYSSKNCTLVPLEINSLLVDRAADRGSYAIGVSFVKARGKFASKVRINGVTKHLGYYDNAKEAHNTYIKEKEINIKRMALDYKDRISNDVFKALIDWKVAC